METTMIYPQMSPLTVAVLNLISTNLDNISVTKLRKLVKGIIRKPSAYSLETLKAMVQNLIDEWKYMAPNDFDRMIEIANVGIMHQIEKVSRRRVAAKKTDDSDEIKKIDITDPKQKIMKNKVYESMAGDFRFQVIRDAETKRNIVKVWSAEGRYDEYDNLTDSKVRPVVAQIIGVELPNKPVKKPKVEMVYDGTDYKVVGSNYDPSKLADLPESEPNVPQADKSRKTFKTLDGDMIAEFEETEPGIWTLVAKSRRTSLKVMQELFTGECIRDDSPAHLALTVAAATAAYNNNLPANGCYNTYGLHSNGKPYCKVDTNTATIYWLDKRMCRTHSIQISQDVLIVTCNGNEFVYNKAMINGRYALEIEYEFERLANVIMGCINKNFMGDEGNPVAIEMWDEFATKYAALDPEGTVYDDTDDGEEPTATVDYATKPFEELEQEITKLSGTSLMDAIYGEGNRSESKVSTDIYTLNFSINDIDFQIVCEPQMAYNPELGMSKKTRALHIGKTSERMNKRTHLLGYKAIKEQLGQAIAERLS